MVNIEAIRLGTGTWIARPAGACGNVGWSPFAWTACYASSETKATMEFERLHGDKINEHS